MTKPTLPLPTAPLPTLADFAPFAPVHRRMAELTKAQADARAATLRERAKLEEVQRVEGRDGGDNRAYQRAVQAEEAALEAARAYHRQTAWPAERAARAALLPPAVADIWRPVVEAVAGSCQKAAAAVAQAVKLRDELAAGGLPMPFAEAVPADLFGDPADGHSPLGKLLAAVKELAAVGK